MKCSEDIEGENERKTHTHIESEPVEGNLTQLSDYDSPSKELMISGP